MPHLKRRHAVVRRPLRSRRGRRLRDLSSLRRVRMLSFFRLSGIRACAGSRSAAAVNFHHHALNGYARRVNHYEPARPFQGQSRAALKHHIHSGDEMNLSSSLKSVVSSNSFLLVLAHGYRKRTPNRFSLVARDHLMLVALHLFKLVVPDCQVVVVADRLVPIRVDIYVLILFGVNEYLLFALFVFDVNLVEAAAAFGTVRFEDDCLGLFIGQLVGRHLRSVIDRAYNDGLVWIAFQEINYDLVAYARYVDCSPLLTRRVLTDSNPAGTVRVALTFTIPVKLNFDATILVRRNLFARWANHHSRLRAAHSRLLCN